MGKRRQKEAQRAKREEMREKGETLGTMKPNEMKSTYRHSDRSLAAAAAEELRPPIVQSLGSLGVHQFYSTEDPQDMFQWLQDACEDMGSCDLLSVNQEDWTLEVHMNSANNATTGEDMRIELQIYRVSDEPEDEGIFGIAASCREGTLFEFTGAWREILETLRDGEMAWEDAGDALSDMPEAQYNVMGLIQPTELLRTKTDEE